MVVCFVEMCHNVRYEAKLTRHEMRVPLGMFLRERERENTNPTNPTAESSFKI